MGLSLPTSSPRMGLCYRSNTVESGKGFWASSACSFLLRSKFSGSCPNCGLKFQLRAWLTVQPTHGNGSEIPSNCGCPDLPGYLLSSHTQSGLFLRKKKRTNWLWISPNCTFFPLKTFGWDQSITRFDKAFVNLSRPGLH